MRNNKALRTFALFCCLILIRLSPATAQQSNITLAGLSQNQTLNGFKVVSVYLNDANKPMGGRFAHQTTGFTLDLLQIESVPQAFVWVNTLPVSDKGEPHTQEHLLITKGNKGHDINTRDGMSLAASTAFTSQLHTVYSFNTAAGSTVFYDLFERLVDALLYPDYTSEEVSREVRNWGITQNKDSSLRLEEKGSVYNEMSTTMNNRYSVMYDTLGRLLYGHDHPNAFNAGGLPADIRVLNAHDIQKFHDENYFLGNMGAIVSLPKSIQLTQVLTQMSKILQQLGAKSNAPKRLANTKLPAPGPAQNHSIVLVGYPLENTREPGTMLLAYPPTLQLNTTEIVLLNNFLTVFAGDPTTNLYKLFVDSKTKISGFDAQNVYAYVDDKQGYPVYMGVDGISADNLSKEKGALVREKILEELKRIAAFKDHSAELLAFNKRFENSLISLKRYFDKFVNSPPKFGFRNTYDAWYTQVTELNKLKEFKKSVTLKPQFDSIHQLLATGKNIWKKYLEQWNLTTATPFVAISKATPELITKNEVEKKQRAAEEVARLKSVYAAANDQAAILQYKAAYDANTAVLEKAEQENTAKFIEHPPLTADDELNYTQTKLNGGVPMVASVFANMTSATTGLALGLQGVPKNKLKYLALLPQLLTGTGIVKDGKAISYEDMSQMLQRQILSLQCEYSNNGNTGRSELLIKGAGNNATEAQRAITWMNDVLQHPNWQKENLPRIRDLVEQEFSNIRRTMQQPEEYWVNDPGTAYRFQSNTLVLVTSSFLTKAFNIFRLKWMLTDGGRETDNTAIQTFLSSLKNAHANRWELNKLLSVISAEKMIADSAGSNKDVAMAFDKLPETAKTVAKDAAKDLQQMLNDIPDTSLNEDWKFVCNTIQQDLQQTPAKTLADLNELRKSLLKTGNARMFEISSKSTADLLLPGINKMLAQFDKSPVNQQEVFTDKIIIERVKERMHTNETPLFVGLVNPNSPTGVFINSVPLVKYRDTSKQQLLTILAAELYAGGGKQSVYTKTTGAGLSYSTGVGANPVSGRFNYYAERTPELPQTLRFVIDQVKNAPKDPNVVDYVVSLVVGYTRSASDYESRGEAMANDLADGYTPEVVKNFRRAVLQLRKQPGLVDDIYKYKDAVYEKILPGYGIAGKDVANAVYFVIGNDKQMASYETYLKAVEGISTILYRLYPRDFWMVN